MTRLLPVLLTLWPALALAQPALDSAPEPAVAEAPVAAPVLTEVLVEDQDARVRLRYVLPGLDPLQGADLARALCLSNARAHAPLGWEVVVSIADAQVPFGQTDPGVIQIFEGFTLTEDDCIWSDF